MHKMAPKKGRWIGRRHNSATLLGVKIVMLNVEFEKERERERKRKGKRKRKRDYYYFIITYNYKYKYKYNYNFLPLSSSSSSPFPFPSAFLPPSLLSLSLSPVSLRLGGRPPSLSVIF